MKMHFEVEGNPVSKANSRRIVRRGNKIASIKSEKGLAYESSCIYQLRAQNKHRKPMEGKLGIEITIWYSSRRPDLDPSIILDCLQKAEVVENDRQFHQMVFFKELDKENPRAEIDIWVI